MKKLILLIICGVLLVGCAHNEHMAKMETARWEAYGQAMAAYYQSLPANRGEIVDLQVDESGKLSGLKVYASDQKTPPPPREPEEIKPWGAQMLESGSALGISAMKWGAGLMAIKIVTDNAGDDIRGSYNENSNNSAAGNQVIDGGEIAKFGDSDQSTTETVSDSYNTDQAETNQSYADSYNQDASVNDGYNQDTDNSDNSINDGYNQDTDNSIKDSQNPDNRYNYGNDNSAAAEN